MICRRETETLQRGSDIGKGSCEEDVIVTEELLKRGKSSNGGWSDRQIAILGVTRPHNSGWYRQLLGRRVSAEAVRQFVSLKDRHLKTAVESAPVANDYETASRAAVEVLAHCDRLMSQDPGDEALAVIRKTKLVSSTLLHVLAVLAKNGLDGSKKHRR